MTEEEPPSETSFSTKMIMSNVCVSSVTVIRHEILGPVSGIMLLHTGNKPCDALVPFHGVLQNVQ